MLVPMGPWGRPCRWFIVHLICTACMSKAFAPSGSGLQSFQRLCGLLPSSTRQSWNVRHSRRGDDESNPDPFRHQRASISPVVINALVPALFGEEVDPAEVAAAAVENRRSNRSSGLTEEEEKAVAGRIYGVIANLDELRFMLTTAVARTPSIAKYGMLSDYGVSDIVEDDPLARMNQAECLLALYMLHMEKQAVSSIDFLDVDKVEVLAGWTPT